MPQLGVVHLGDGGVGGAQAVLDAVQQLPLVLEGLRVRQVQHKILVSCHCSMDGGLPITHVHDVTAALEDRVKEQFPQIFRVTIHPEPVEES